MSGSTIYWITRLDSIVNLASGLTFTFAVLAGSLLLGGGIAYAAGKDFGEAEVVAGAKKSLKYGKNLAIAAVAVACIRAFVPTTREAAAIMVLPAVVNNETVQAEAREIYDLAKAWLRELAPKQEPTP